MEFFTGAFHAILYEPVFNGLILIYEYLPIRDFGLAVIVSTFLIRLMLHPFVGQSIRSQKILSDLQPKVKELQEKYKDDREKQLKETMSLYKKERISPFSGILPLLIQFPILVALYKVFWWVFKPGSMADLYAFVPDPGYINPVFLGFINLSQGSIAVAIVAAAAQFWQTKMLLPKQTKLKDGKTDQFANIMQKQMTYFFPVITLFFLMALPSAVGLYWATTSILTIFQQMLIFKQKNKAVINNV